MAYLLSRDLVGDGRGRQEHNRVQVGRVRKHGDVGGVLGPAADSLVQPLDPELDACHKAQHLARYPAHVSCVQV